MVDGDPNVNKISEIRRSHARAIVRSILTHGLLAYDAQVKIGIKSLTSMDHRPHVNGLFVFPASYPFQRGPVHEMDVNGYMHKASVLKGGDNATIAKHLLQQSLYGDGSPRGLVYALYHVLVERENENYSHWTKPIVDERLQNNVVFALPARQIPLADYVTEGLYADVRIQNPVKPSIVLAPEMLRDDLGDLLEGFDGIVKYIDARETRPFAGRMKDYSHVPDYESALRELANELGEPIFFHGVRLPTEEDVVSGRVG